MEKAEIAIQFRQVSYQLEEAEILSRLAFEIHQGETVVLVGRSGSGKTTTLKLVNRLLEPTHGEVRVQNRPTTSWDPIELRRRIGYVIQDVGLFPHFTVDHHQVFSVTAVADDRKGESLVVIHVHDEETIPDILKKLGEMGLPNLFIPRKDKFLKVDELPVLGTGKINLKEAKRIATEHFE